MVDLPYTEEEYMEHMKRAFEGQHKDLMLLMKAHEAFVLVSLLQFAQRGLPESSPMRAFCEQIGRQFQAAVIEVTDSQIGEIMETGWNPAYDVDQEGRPRDDRIEVHNVWTIYGMNDGQVAEQPLAMASRPQDWGHPRWTYHLFRFEWLSAPNGKRYTNNAHCWTDMPVEPGEVAELFAPLVAQILMPGSRPEVCGREYLREDDFWMDEWGSRPPFYEGGEAFSWSDEL